MLNNTRISLIIEKTYSIIDKVQKVKGTIDKVQKFRSTIDKLVKLYNNHEMEYLDRKVKKRSMMDP